MPYDKQIVIDLALSQVGYHEKATNAELDDPKANSGDGNWNKYSRDLDKLGNFYNGRKNGYAWCDCFVDWCFITAYGRAVGQKLLCQPDNSAGAGCSFSAGYYRNKGQFHINNPQPGDQIFFGTGANNVWHTGIVVSVGNNHVYTVEGNTTDSVGRRSYALNDTSIYGYGRPDWGMSGMASAPSTPATPSTPSVSTPVASAPKAEKTCTVKLPELKKGSKNGYVKTLQDLLIKRGFSCGGKIDPVTRHEVSDGDFGSTTENAVKLFQKQKNLVVDGEVGASTWPALMNQ